MTTRDFDPVLSAALRHELEALADESARVDGRRAGTTRVRLARRPQVWISVVTAVLLIAATIGVLRVTGTVGPPAGPDSGVVAPLSRITDPKDAANYVARSVRVLVDAAGTGTGTRRFEVPADVRQIRTYIACAPSRPYAIEVDRLGHSSSTCDRTIAGWFSGPQTPGRHTVTVKVPKGVQWVLTLIAEPGPTVSTGALIDPLTQLRDLRNPDALTGDTRPLLRITGTGDAAAQSFTLPNGVDRVRVYFPCRPTSAVTAAVVDGHRISGCQNAIAHWFDLTPSARVISASVSAPGDVGWSLLVVPSSSSAAASPANALLPYPADGEVVIARARGAGGQATGSYTRRTNGIGVRIVCRGSGWIEFDSPDGGTNTRGGDCRTPTSTGFGGAIGGKPPQRLRWTVTPHGDISWAVVITDNGTTG